jgi:DNA-binding transcriptional MerR regulator
MSTGDGTSSENTLRIHELARATGLSVRNIRSHQERGLLPAPEVRMRVGYYGPEHIDRLRLILKLQAEGLTLDGIKRLLDASAGDGTGLLRVTQAAEAADQLEPPEVLSAEELAERLGLTSDETETVAGTAARLGILMPLGEAQFQVLSPSLIDAAEEVLRGGITITHALEVIEDVSEHAEAVAHRFVQAFIEDVWDPFVAAGMPPQDWGRVSEVMERTRPVAATVLLAAFRQRMSDVGDTTFGEIARRISAEETSEA